MARLGSLSGLLLVFTSTIVWLIVYLPPFERMAYNQNERTNYENTIVYGGYKAGPGIPRYTSIDDLKERKGGTIETDVSNLQPTGIYMDLSKDDIVPDKHINIFKRAQNSWGQFYEVKLDSGEKILVLIDDYIINLPSEGTVVLPVCGTQDDIDLSIYNANYGAYDSYWNFATWFAKSDEMEKFRDGEEDIWALGFLVSTGLFLGISIISIVRNKRKQKNLTLNNSKIINKRGMN